MIMYSMLEFLQVQKRTKKAYKHKGTDTHKMEKKKDTQTPVWGTQARACATSHLAPLRPRHKRSSICSECVLVCVCVFVIWSVALIAGEGGGGLAVSPDERGGMGGGGGTLSRHTNTNHMQLFSVSLRGT